MYFRLAPRADLARIEHLSHQIGHLALNIYNAPVAIMGDEMDEQQFFVVMLVEGATEVVSIFADSIDAAVAQAVIEVCLEQDLDVVDVDPQHVVGGNKAFRVQFVVPA